ncbi:3D (Asp-Asp-Asp) domain-containing protein [Oceanobacillus limi]|uniref:3D (Asp-Asp-Asp) domain-containing protein n=1 Tax=Oceanobacillus limi TaxID=930131 RepID=A0A1I0F152_9BACI|nr:3D domain-containing protein [Oceanobacillus limi]SET51730.1 3D (Asp-Asp-Asp) domain-containing protein [Oceanobacillus limi]
MKKLVAGIALISLIAGVSVNNVSAEEYEVEKGDSLWKIAQEFDTTINEIIEINDLEETVIFPEQKLQIYEEYEVRKGDTLYGIGKKYDVSVDELMEWNELSSDLIVIGQVLSIVTTSDEAEIRAASTVSEDGVASNVEPEGKTISVSATAYTAECDGCSGITYTGINLNENRNAKVIAVDPSVIPLGTEVYVEGYGYAIAGDIGSAIKGNRIDIHLPTKKEALEWGVRTVNVTIMNE